MIVLIEGQKIIYLATQAIEAVEYEKDRIEIVTCHCKYFIYDATVTRNEDEFMEKFGSTSYVNTFLMIDNVKGHNSLFITGKITKIKVGRDERG